jgi:glycosyltransferase involved in cell wall biosynthesis
VAAFRDAPVRDLRAELQIATNVRILGFLGRFMEAKGFDVLIDAVQLLAARAPAVPPFVVVAVGYGGMIRENRARIEASRLTPYFRFLDFVNHVGPTLKGLDVMVMPSLWEASGLLAMEAMVAGTPVIGSRCVGLSETLADTPASVAEPGSGASLAAAIEARLHDPGTAEARAFVPEAARRFNSRNTFAALRALYGDVVKGVGR